MPIRIDEAKTPAGSPFMRARVSGFVSLEDAQSMGLLMQPGQPYHRMLVLNLVEKGTEYSPDSRKYFGTMRGNYLRMATVVDSAVIRAAINFMNRLSGGAQDFRMFGTEAEALGWLDGK